MLYTFLLQICLETPVTFHSIRGKKWVLDINLSTNMFTNVYD